MTSLLHSGVWLIGSLGIAFAVYGQMFEKCVKYKNEVPEITGALKVCAEGWEGDTLCRFYNNNCPDIQECNNNVAPVPRDNHCMVCPDTGCIYNGNVYSFGETFPSVDQINMCMCLYGGRGKYTCGNKKIDKYEVIEFCKQ